MTFSKLIDKILIPPVPPILTILLGSLSPPQFPVPGRPPGRLAGWKTEGLVLKRTFAPLCHTLDSRSDFDGVLPRVQRTEANSSSGANTIILGGSGGSTLVSGNLVVSQAFESNCCAAGALGGDVAITGLQLGSAEIARILKGAVGVTAGIESGIAIATGSNDSLGARGN